ncbi:MAG: helix-turn-helix domain-containing protein [Hyphomicrobium sp.]|nr:helix-turn-helix domain-containing protein [Hyphomicrobium sp.]
MEQAGAIRALGALANNHRLAIFRALVRAGEDGLSASELALAAGIGATNLTFHTKELERAGLIRTWREGRRIRSALEIETMRTLMSFLFDDCCGGRPELCGPRTVSAQACCPTPQIHSEDAVPIPNSAKVSRSV